MSIYPNIQTAIMVTAMATDDINKVINSIHSGADINFFSDEWGQKVLDYAIRYEYLILLNILIEKNVNINYLRRAGQVPPLHFACRWKPIAVIKILLKGDADINFIDSEGRTPLHCAIWSGDINKVKLLISHGADISICTKKGETCLDCLTHYYLGNESHIKEIYLFLLRTYFNILELGDISTPVSSTHHLEHRI